MTHAPEANRGRRMTWVMILAGLTVGLSGFFMGIRQSQNSAEHQREVWTQAAEESPTPGFSRALPEAPLYASVPESGFRVNDSFQSRLSTLLQPEESLAWQAQSLSPQQKERLETNRVQRRQYEGAPPLAPHPVDQRSSATCLECHGRPMQVGSLQIARISHTHLTNCIQCHVSSVGPASWWQKRNEALSDGNSFDGDRGIGAGKRAYAGAPPVIPHTTFMRDNCISCHGPGGSVAMRTSHPDRQNCTQCHAPNASLDQRLAAGLPPPLPAAEWDTQTAR